MESALAVCCLLLGRRWKPAMPAHLPTCRYNEVYRRYNYTTPKSYLEVGCLGQ